MKSNKNKLILGVILILIGIFTLGYATSKNGELFGIINIGNNNDDGNNYGERNYCTIRGDACTMEYRPVCGWYDSNVNDCEKTYPGSKDFANACLDTFSNPCTACSNEQVKYWTEGECSKIPEVN